MTPAERSIIAYTSAAHALIHILEWTYAALLIEVGDEFGISWLALGALGNVFAYTFGFGALPSGILTDRLGSPRVLYICLLGSGLSAVLVGMSQTTIMLGIGLALMGLVMGLYHPAGISLIAQGIRQRGMALGLHGVSGNLGIAATPLLAGGFAFALGWRWAYFFLAAVAVTLGLFLRFVSLSSQPQHTEVSPRPAEASQMPAPPSQQGSSSLTPLILVYCAFVLNGFVYSASRTFLPTHISSEGNEAIGGSLATVALLMGAVGQYIGGSLSQRFPLERLAPLMAIVVVPCLVAMGVTSGAPLVLASAAFVLFSFGGQPIYTGLIADYTPGRLLGRSYGISFFATFGLASVGSTYAGFFAGRWDTTSAAFLAVSPFAAVAFLMGVGLWLIWRRRPLAQERVHSEASPTV
ncbi:MAG: MFS transporter [Dehalococcoidia bacterium]